MRKIWQEETLESLSSYRNLRDRHKEIIPEIIKFVEVNQPILSEWILDQWVEDRNLVIPMPLNVVELQQQKMTLNSARWYHSLSCLILQRKR